MAAPAVIRRQLHHAAANRIKENIGCKFEKIGIGINDDRFESALKEMSASFLSPVDPTGIAKGEVLHDAGKWNVTHLYCQMDVIGHQAEGMDAVTEPLYPFLEKEIKAVTVIVFEEDILPGVPTQDHVI